MAPLSTTSATARNRPRCTAWCNSTPSNGDNGAHRFNTLNDRGWIEVTITNVGSTGQFGTAVLTQPLMIQPVAGTIYCTLEANGAYTPANAETFRVDIEGFMHTD